MHTQNRLNIVSTSPAPKSLARCNSELESERRRSSLRAVRAPSDLDFSKHSSNLALRPLHAAPRRSAWTPKFVECSTFWDHFGSLKMSQMINLTTVSRFGIILLQSCRINAFKMTPKIGSVWGALPEQGAHQTVVSRPRCFN